MLNNYSPFILTALALFGCSKISFADPTYTAKCTAFGDGLSLSSTGEGVLEQRLVEFKPLGAYIPHEGQKGLCVIKKDPPGFRWVRCWKKDGQYATGDWEYPRFITPNLAIPNSVQHRGWGGACKVKL